MNEPAGKAGNQKLERFVRSFEASSKATEALLDALANGDDCLLAAIDEMIEEVRGLRAELKEFSEALRESKATSAIEGVARGIFGSVPRRSGR